METMRRGEFGHLFRACLFLVILGAFIQGELVRNHGNILRNQLLIQKTSPGSLDAIATRLQGSWAGRRVKSTFDVTQTPFWTISRWSPTTEEASGFQFKLGLLELVEYEESSNGTDGLDYSDIIVSTVSLSSPKWSSLVETAGFGDDMISWFVYGTTLQGNGSSPHSPPLIDLSAGIAAQRAYITAADRVLGPNTWEFEISINGYPLQSNFSRLALKFYAEYGGQWPVYRPDIPIAQRDNVEEIEDDVLMVPNNQSFTFEDATDKGFFSWKNMGTDIGGHYPEIDSLLLDQNTFARTLRVINSPIFIDDNDIVPTAPSADSYVSQPTTPRFYLYFSFMVTQPSQIIWDPFVGLDEQDGPPTKSLASQYPLLTIPLWILLYISFS